VFVDSYIDDDRLAALDHDMPQDRAGQRRIVPGEAGLQSGRVACLRASARRFARPGRPVVWGKSQIRSSDKESSAAA